MSTTMPTGQPTLEMVAAVAGVSRSTVSRVINESSQVTSQAVAAVAAAIELLGYVPNRAARSLASRRTQSIALVIPENTAKFFADPYFAAVIQGAAVHLAGTDYTLTLLIASETDAGKTRRYLRAGNVDGALILSHHSDDRSYVTLARTLPVVFGGRPMSQEGPGAIYVDVDNVAAAKAVTENLLQRGRTKIATICGPQDMAAGLDRLKGWRLALREAGIQSDLIEYGDFSPASGAAAMIRLLERGEPVDGIFVASAQMASGAMQVLRDRGLTVPDDLGVVTFDNDYFAQSARPALTTIEQPTVDVGQRMATILLNLIDGRTVEPMTMMPTRLIDRGSA